MLRFLNFTLFFFYAVFYRSHSHRQRRKPLYVQVQKNFQLSSEEDGQKAPKVFEEKSDRLKTSLL